MGSRMSGREEQFLRILRARAFREQDGKCYWCKEQMNEGAENSDPRQLTGDHLKPLHQGGKTVPGNIVAACRECNNERHPELHSMGGGIVARAGNEAPRSPFEALALNYPNKMAREFNKLFRK